jgi:hypothetical protein
VAERPDGAQPRPGTADRKAIPRKSPKDDSRLVQAARAGILTKDNTKRGTRGRQAVDRITYLRRKEARPELPAREALGHERPEVRSGRTISVLLDRPEPFVVLEAASRREASRAGRYDSLTGQLAAGRVTPERFRQMVSAWRPIRGERFLADPDRVLAVMEARRAGEEELFVYRSGRAA